MKIRLLFPRDEGHPEPTAIDMDVEALPARGDTIVVGEDTDTPRFGTVDAITHHYATSTYIVVFVR